MADDADIFAWVVSGRALPSDPVVRAVTNKPKILTSLCQPQTVIGSSIVICVIQATLMGE